MPDKVALRKEQIAFIDQVLMNYNLTLTEVAKGADLASTTLTRFYNGSPKHVLSSTTLAKIKDKYPIGEIIQGSHANDNRGDSELAITFAIQVILKALLSKQKISREWLEDNFILAQNHYRKHRLPNAALLMGELLASVSPEAPERGRSPSRLSLELAPLALR
jgi:hypothetical protein